MDIVQPKGTNKIIFHLSGYETKTEIITNDGTEITLNIILIEKEMHLEEVIISTLYNKRFPFANINFERMVTVHVFQFHSGIFGCEPFSN